MGLCFSLSLLAFLCHRPLLAKDAHSLFFLSEVEAVIHPRFLAELLSPDPQLDLLALAKELKQEEGLTPEEVSQGRERDNQGARGLQGRGDPRGSRGQGKPGGPGEPEEGGIASRTGETRDTQEDQGTEGPQ